MVSFKDKLKEFITLLEKWLTVPDDLAQLDVWLDSVEELVYSYEFTDIEQQYVDKIIDRYEEEFRLLIKTHCIETPTQEYLDGLLVRKQIEQRTPEWYAQMTTILSASELGNLFAAPRTRAKLVLSKTQPYTPRNNPLAVPSNRMSAFDWGIRFEPVVKQIYEYKYGAEVKELGRMYHQIDSRCTASPDGLIYNAIDEKRKGHLIEIKCPVTREIDGTIPKDYYAQMQMQLQVTGLYACEYVEAQFSSQYNYNSMKYGPGQYNGVIALVQYADPTYDKEYYYQYSPVNAEEWEPSKKEGEEIIELIPWSLLQWSEQLVVTSADWWKNIQPAIENFWIDVEKAKRGDFVVPDSTRVKKQKEEKCVIIFHKMDES